MLRHAVKTVILVAKNQNAEGDGDGCDEHGVGNRDADLRGGNPARANAPIDQCRSKPLKDDRGGVKTKTNSLGSGRLCEQPADAPLAKQRNRRGEENKDEREIPVSGPVHKTIRAFLKRRSNMKDAECGVDSGGGGPYRR